MQEKPKHEKPGTTEEDQKERGYYYDDAHGYEEYEPEEDGEAENGVEQGDDDLSTEGAM